MADRARVKVLVFVWTAVFAAALCVAGRARACDTTVGEVSKTIEREEYLLLFLHDAE
ncbi:unnamed protein product, partial [marine sediment metagenome]